MNSTLTSLVNDVYTLTNRPDLVGETLIAVRNATLKMHSIDFFDKDLIETGVSFDYSQTQQSINYRELMPRWRALKYVRKCYIDPATSTPYPGEILTVITPDAVLDSYSYNRENVCYLAGQEIKVRSKDALQYCLLGAYLFPDVTPEGFNSWIANECPTAILYEATAVVFKTIGYDEQNAAYKDLSLQEQRMLIQNNIQTVGY